MIKGFKGFNADLKCRDFQFQVGGEYEESSAKICEKGFHFCENPMDVLGYYPPSDSRYAEVEGDGKTDKDGDNSKVACSKLKVGVEIGISGLISAGVKFVLERVNWADNKATNTGYQSASTNTGDQSASTNTGYRSASTNTGYQSASTNTGYRSASTNTGYQSASTNTGYQSASTNTGYQSASTNTGDQSASTNTGYRSASTNTGDQSASTNTGYQSASTNTGDQSASTNTGYQSASTNTGDQSASTNTGYRSASTNTGYQSASTNTGHRSASSVEGEESVAVAIGYESKAKGAIGCWIVVAEWREDESGKDHIIDVQCANVDGENIKQDTFYQLKDGKFVTAKED